MRAMKKDGRSRKRQAAPAEGLKMFGLPWRSGLFAWMGNLQSERLSMYVNAQIIPATGGIVMCGIRILI